MKKIKSKIKNWLFKEELERINEQTRIIKNLGIIAKTQDAQIDTLFSMLRRNGKDLAKEALEVIEKEIGSAAIDVHMYQPSWAIISIRGQKKDMVRFIQLPDKYIREVERFLRHFPKERINMDLPPNFMPKGRFFI